MLPWVNLAEPKLPTKFIHDLQMGNYHWVL